MKDFKYKWKVKLYVEIRKKRKKKYNFIIKLLKIRLYIFFGILEDVSILSKGWDFFSSLDMLFVLIGLVRFRNKYESRFWFFNWLELFVVI